MSTPAVDVVIAVHTAQRPIERAVSSVLEHTAAPVRVTVVCHGVTMDDIARRLGRMVEDERLRLEHLDDGIPSPAGPFNRGLELVTAEFAAILGSDDEFQPHAIDSWLAETRRSNARAVICAQSFASGMTARTPLTRPFRQRRLDAVRDRLAYRTAPLGLLATDLIGDSRFTTGLTTGEDIAFALRAWFSGAPISFDRRGPGYLVHDEADQERVTAVMRAMHDEFAFLPFVVDADWFIALPERMRRAIATKLLRNHVVPAILVRVAAGALKEADRVALSEIVERIRASASAPESVLAMRDAQVLAQLAESVESVRNGAHAYGPLLSPRGLLPSALTRLFASDAPPRLLGAAAFARS